MRKSLGGLARVSLTQDRRLGLVGGASSSSYRAQRLPRYRLKNLTDRKATLSEGETCWRKTNVQGSRIFSRAIPSIGSARRR